MDKSLTSAAAAADIPDAGIGVLLVNLGTPDAPTPAAVRHYLAEFLWDPRVVEAPRLLWWLALHGVILRTRPRRSARAYASIWTAQGSPLLVHTRNLATALDAALSDTPGPVACVGLGMRYGEPSIARAMRELRDRDVRHLLVLPLYPQYSGTTTASVFDAVAAELRHWRRVPALRFIDAYFARPGYIDALAASVRAHWQAHGRGERLLVSFHGIPERYVRAGDPYLAQCRATTAVLVAALGLADDQWLLTFQSRLGREPWLQPYTDETLRALPARGVRAVDVICPGFAVDCLETLEETAILNRELFLAAGGERYAYIAALNAEPDHVALLAQLVREQLQGWPDQARGP